MNTSTFNEADKEIHAQERGRALALPSAIPQEGDFR